MLETDSESAITLLIAICKALCDFDSVAAESEGEETETMAKEKFFHIAQFLYLIGKQRNLDGT